MDEITYIMGAGASVGSMPLVSTFEERFRFFLNIALKRGVLSPKVELFAKSCEQFLVEVGSHLSFDTFFKKLFHQAKDELIQRYKEVLLIYFLFEHMVNLKDPSGLPHTLNGYGKAFNIDPRYDALIAGLLRPIRGSTDFFCKVNFITWNYDLNLLGSLRQFLVPDQSLELVLAKREQPNIFKLSSQCTLYHVNGIAFHPCINNFEILSMNVLMPRLFEIIETQNDSENALTAFASNISFAWEWPSARHRDQFFSEIQSSIQQSKTIVLVGYSLPLYNRLIDMKYLNATILAGKKLIIQDPDADALESVLQDSFNIEFVKGLNSPLTQSEIKRDCSSFFVPKDIFIESLNTEN